VSDLRLAAREIAIAVVSEAIRRDLTDLPPDVDVAAEVDRAMWWPDYVPYVDALAERHPIPGDEARSAGLVGVGSV
jgi:hypothetical protein